MPELAGDDAGGAEALHADVVHVDTAMHARLDVGLGDDQRLRLVEERLDLRRHRDDLTAAPQDRQVVLAQQAEPAFRHRLKIVIGRDGVFLHAEQREVVGVEPFQELDRLGDVADRHRRRIGLEFRDRLVDARHHRLPVAHAEPDVGQHSFERTGDFFALLRIVDAIDMNMNKAFVVRTGLVRLPWRRREFAVTVARHREDRMRNKPDADAAFGQLAHQRVNQERHVVVDDFDHRDRLEPLAVGRGGRNEAYFRLARFTDGKEGPGVAGELGEFVCAVDEEILGRRAREQNRCESRRNIAEQRA